MTAAAVLDEALEAMHAPRIASARRWCIVTCEYPPEAMLAGVHRIILEVAS